MTRFPKQAAGAAFGFACGALVVAAALYFWPFAAEQRNAVALAAMNSMKDRQSFALKITGDNVLATHGGAFPFRPFPDSMVRFSDPTLHDVFALVTKFRNRPDGDIIGFGTELEIAHEDSNLLRGRLMTHTLWSIVVPGRGTLHLYQVENNWGLLKRVLLPALLSGRGFRGEFTGVNTLGPLADHRGIVLGGTGDFADRAGTFIEIGTLRELHPGGNVSGEMKLRVGFDATPSDR